MIEIKIEKNDKELGSRPVKCESRLRELEQLLKTQDSPIEFMCHSLGISTNDKHTLDAYLHQTFQKNIPSNFHLLTGPIEKNHSFFTYKESSKFCFTIIIVFRKVILNNYHIGSEEYPTLLHFAARWGLENLAMQLVECPGGDVACETKNVSGKTPADLAEMVGFSKLALSLKSFSVISHNIRNNLKYIIK